MGTCDQFLEEGSEESVSCGQESCLVFVWPRDFRPGGSRQYPPFHGVVAGGSVKATCLCVNMHGLDG